MIKLHAVDSYEIRKRGLVFCFEADQIPQGMWDPCALKGKTVAIDGETHRVVGVETFSICRSPDHPYVKSFGLLVAD
jgi:hypothetical protein